MSQSVASASVDILPTFKGGTRELEKVMGPSLDRAGRTSGERYGSSLVAGIMSSSAITKLVGAGGIGAVLFAGINRYKAIDTATAKLRGLGNEAAAVDTIMANALASVKGTAFGLGDAVTVAAQLTAAQIPAGQELEATLKSVANAAAASGSSLSEMGSIYAKVASLNKAQNDSLQQVADRGVPIYQALAKQLGVTSDEVFKLATAGKVGFREFQNAMTDAAGTVAAEMGTTLDGRVDNLMAAVGRLGAGFASSGLEEGKDLLSELTDVIDDLTPGAKVLGDVLGSALGVITAVPMPIYAAAAAALLLSRNSAALSATSLKAAASLRVLATSAGAARVMVASAGGEITTTTARANLLRTTVGRAGSAVLGAFGGPVGLAITGVSVALGGLITLWQQGEQAAQSQRDAVDQLTASLDSNTGAMTGNTVAVLNEQLKDVLPLLDQIGVDYTGMVAAIAAGDPDGKIAAIRDELTKVNIEFKKTKDQQGVQAAVKASVELEKALERVSAAQSQFKRATKASGEELDGVTPKFDTLKDAIDGAFGGLNTLASQNSAIRDLAQSVQDNGKSIDATTKGGIANLDALQSTISAMAENAGNDYGKFVGNVSGLMQYLQASGVNTQNVMGAVRAAVANVAGKRWAMYLDGSQAISEANQIVKAMRTAVAAAALASKAGIGALGGALTGAAASAVAQYNRVVAAAAQSNKYVASTFKGVSSSAGGASGSMGKAGKTAKQVAADMAALRREIYDLAREWLKPSAYSSDALSVMDQINAAYKEGAVSKSARASLITSVKKTDKELTRIVKARDKKADEIEEANQRLADAISARDTYRESVIEGFKALGDLAKFAAQTQKTITEVYTQGDRLVSVTRQVTSAGTAGDMVDGLRKQVEEATKFKKAFTDLQKLGLNDTSLQNLMSEFLSSGDSSIASSLLTGGKSAVGEVNDLMKQLGGLVGTETSGWANEVANSMYKAGISTAEGYLKGLQSQDAALKKQYEKMADDLVGTIKRKLGIKSPSRVMGQLADYTSEGWNKNLHLDPVAPGIDVDQIPGRASSVSGVGDGTELWLMLDDDRPVRGVVVDVLRGEAKQKMAARRGGNR